METWTKAHHIVSTSSKLIENGSCSFLGLVYHSVFTSLYFQVLIYKSVLTNLCIQACIYKHVFTSMYLQACIYKSVFTSLSISLHCHGLFELSLYDNVKRSCFLSPSCFFWVCLMLSVVKISV